MNRLRKPGTILLLLVTMAISVVVSACGASQDRDPLELVPAQADLLGSLNLTEVLGDADVAEAYGLLSALAEDAPATLSDLLALSEEEMGLDLSGFGELVIFADIDAIEGPLGRPVGEGVNTSDFVGILAPTHVERDELFEAVRANASVLTVDGEHEGVALLQLDDGAALVALVDGVVALGSPRAVQAVIDVARSDAPIVSGGVLNLYDDLGAAWGKLAVELPSDLAESLGGTDELGLPVDISGLLEINALGVVATKETTDAVLKIVLRYPTAAAATDTQETLSALVTLATSLLGDDQLAAAAAALEIRSAGTDVTVEFREDVQESLDDLRDSLEGFEGINSFGVGL